ncbi:DUF1840 domain-containing protein [Enterovibrio makurazakiensis]|uniref:DUF1840 domain-containing protein n=1 Tax=Enterovibrio gelatinilyticus TaxID=2899819 RepID=A0ABT5R0D1_9GAMM|nr:DUF1840 domain-containing protein [Enterovibrio sp. ZSDZ42]MDD1793726.1 DUF1840 domain-containing protein [Enterovibrio sp. ZSDZ42]
MLIRFSCKAYADITMFGEVGLQMLKMMGHSETVPGAILAEDVPAALGNLFDAIETEKTKSAAAPTSSDEDEEDSFIESPVSIGHRAIPLIELLTAAANDKCDVMWQDATNSTFL